MESKQGTNWDHNGDINPSLLEESEIDDDTKKKEDKNHSEIEVLPLDLSHDRKGKQQSTRQNVTSPKVGGKGARSGGERGGGGGGGRRKRIALIRSVMKVAGLSAIFIGIIGLSAVSIATDGIEHGDDGHHSNNTAMMENFNEGFSLAFLAGLSLVVFALHPMKCVVGVVLWVIWLFQALLREGTDVWQDVTERFLAASLSTKIFVRHGIGMLAAWGRLLAPFLTDILILLQELISRFSWEQRLIGAFTLLVLYGVYRTYQAVKARKDAILVALFQGSYLLIGPLVWFAFRRAIPARFAEGVLLVITTVAPTFLSLHAFRYSFIANGGGGEGQKRWKKSVWDQWKTCDLWLSYWSCWPLVIGLTSLCTNYITTAYAAQLYKEGSRATTATTAASAGAAGGGGGGSTVIRTQMFASLATLCIWLQFWYGSKAFFSLASKLAAQIVPSSLGVLTANMSSVSRVIKPLLGAGGNLSLSALRQQLSIMKTLGYLWENKLIFGPITFFVGILIFSLGFQVYTMMTSVLTSLIWGGVALRSARAVANKEASVCSATIAFWILAQLLEASVWVPVAGSMISLFKPVLLPIFLAIGDEVLKIALTLLGENYNYFAGTCAAVSVAYILNVD
mmetsp:Transcript_6414/g.10006  ORF Transcript_6414/g.10006 Transcript_6414/m.10006 type:complete len:622 (+) Transcript_6414:153-2018(+)